MGIQNSTWYLTNVKLEINEVATPFVPRSRQEELALCQRYYFQRDGYYFRIPGNGTSTAIRWVMSLPVSMRSAPTMSWANRTLLNCTWTDITSDTEFVYFSLAFDATNSGCGISTIDIKADAEL